MTVFHLKSTSWSVESCPDRLEQGSQRSPARSLLIWSVARNSALLMVSIKFVLSTLVIPVPISRYKPTSKILVCIRKTTSHYFNDRYQGLEGPSSLAHLEQRIRLNLFPCIPQASDRVVEKFNASDEAWRFGALSRSPVKMWNDMRCEMGLFGILEENHGKPVHLTVDRCFSHEQL